MRFLHITDIHFLREYPQVDTGYLSIFKGMTNPIEQLKQGLSQIKLEGIEAVLITGDLVECGTFEDYKVLKEELQQIFGDIPLVVTLGNHDDKPAFYKGWLEEEPRGEPYHTITTLNDWTVIGLDISDEHHQDGLITKRHCEWLKEALENVGDTQTILIMHHHILPNQATIKAVTYEKEFYEIVKESSILAILCGHTHYAYKGEFAGKDYFTADNLSFVGVDECSGIVRFEEYSGFNECFLKENKLEVRRVPAMTDRRLLARVTFK